MKLENQSQESTTDIIANLNLVQREIYMMGGNDYEIPAIAALIEKFQRKEISGEEAIKEAHKIKSRKMEYH